MIWSRGSVKWSKTSISPTIQKGSMSDPLERQAREMTQKRRPSCVSASGSFAAGPTPGLTFVALDPDPAEDPGEYPRLEPFSLRVAFLELAHHPYLLDIEDAKWQRTKFEWIGDLLEEVPVLRLGSAGREAGCSDRG